MAELPRDWVAAGELLSYLDEKAKKSGKVTDAEKARGVIEFIELMAEGARPEIQNALGKTVELIDVPLPPEMAKKIRERIDAVFDR